jgi:membrane associated rhomboid family serine protease
VAGRPKQEKPPEGLMEQYRAFQRKYGPRIQPDGVLRPAYGSHVMVYLLIAMNVAIFLLWQVAIQAGEQGVYLPVDLMGKVFIVSLDNILHGFVWTLVGSEFSHIQAYHIVGNMFGLFMFGRDVAGVIGWWRFLLLYLIGGIFASLGHLLLQIITDDPNGALGASGSVMAISMVFACMYPRRIIYLMGIPMPAVVSAFVYIGYDLFGAIGGGDGVAHGAHLGGAAYGLAYGLTMGRLRMHWLFKDFEETAGR